MHFIRDHVGNLVFSVILPKRGTRNIRRFFGHTIHIYTHNGVHKYVHSLTLIIGLFVNDFLVSVISSALSKPLVIVCILFFIYMIKKRHSCLSYFSQYHQIQLDIHTDPTMATQYMTNLKEDTELTSAILAM